MDILISVKKPYCDSILARQKTLELRKSIPRRKEAHRIWIYECGRDGRHMVVGVCILRGTIRADARHKTIQDASCLTESEITAYAAGKPLFVWELGAARILDKPRPLSAFGLSHPPQSWCYVDA
jgi:predicted transcriptional regulator